MKNLILITLLMNSVFAIAENNSNSQQFHCIYIESDGSGISSIESDGSGVTKIDSDGSGVTKIDSDGSGVTKIDSDGSGIQKFCTIKTI